MTRKITCTCKVLACISLYLIISNSTFAQTSGGPDLYGYVWRDSNDPNGPAYSWIDIVNAPGAVQVAGLADDNIRGPFTIGFPFHFYWYDVTTFRVGSNGYIGFTNTPVAHPFPAIPNPSGIQNYIAIMTTDLTFTDNNDLPIPTAQCWYWTSPGNDTLILSFIDVPFWNQTAPGYAGSNTFQAILSAVDSSITFQYQTQIGAVNNPNSFCSIGIENNSGSIGLQHSYNVYPPVNYAVKFYYPSTTTFQVNDASTMYNNNETNGGLFLSKDGAPYTMTAQVRNTGNQPLSSFNVTSRVVNFLNQNQVISVLPTGPLAPGDVEDLVFPDQFVPVTAGTYRHINFTQLTGDATPSNNEKQLELQVVDTTQASILLSFDNGTDAGLGGLSWSGGNGGAGVHFIPPFHPCEITEVRVFIAANTNLVGYSIFVLADDGPGGTPLTLLGNEVVNSINVTTGTWNYVLLSTPITINSGGFYVAWMMGGEGIAIGQNQLAPISNRTYEVLGQATNPNTWAAYRYRELEDIMLNVYINGSAVGLSEVLNTANVSNFYPNPASGLTSIDYNLQISEKLSWAVFDISGKKVLEGYELNNATKGTININTYELENGMYLFSLQNGMETFNRKLTILK